MQNDLYYRFSGRLPIHAAVLTLAISSVAAIFVGAVYGALVRYSPIIYLNLLGTLGLGYVCGLMVKKLGMAMQVRNVAYYHLAALLTAVIAWYSSWVGWVLALSGWEPAVLSVIDPLVMVQTMLAIGEEGAWTIGRSSDEPVKGIFLYAVWAVEAGIVLLVPLGVARGILDEAYCEKTGRWLRESKEFGPFQPIADTKAWTQQLEESGFDVLGSLQPLNEELTKGDRYTLFTLRHAGSADSTHLLRVDDVKVKVEDGKITLDKTPVIRGMYIDRATHDLIAEVLSPPPQSPAAPSDTPPPTPAA